MFNLILEGRNITRSGAHTLLICLYNTFKVLNILEVRFGS